MITLTKIRNKAGLLVGVIFFALLAFVLGDLFRSGSSLFGDDPRLLGVVAGKKIMITEFEATLDKAIENEKQRQNKTSLDEATIDMLRQQAWNQLIYDNIMTEQYAKLGIAVSSDELLDMVQGKNPHPSVVQAFTDPKTGQFNPQAVVTFLKRLDEDKTGETKMRWLNFEKAMKAERIANKYNTLVKGAMYVTKSQAKRQYNEEQTSANLKLVIQRYAEIPDSTIKVEEADITNYYNQNKNKYKQDQNVRGVEFVLYEAVPSDEDRLEILSQIETIKKEFAETKEDTSYVAANSDAPAEFKNYKKGALPLNIDSIMFNSAPGFIYGPYFEGKIVRLAKTLAFVSQPDSVKARHILIKIDNNDKTKAKAKADSLLKMVKSGAPFEALAMQVSADEGSKAKGGDLGWFSEGTMVKPFNDACFNGKKGDLTVVESQFGYHLIEILDKGAETKRVRVAFIDREMRPSSKTYQKFYGQASEFGGKYNTAEKFDKAVIDLGLNKRIADFLKETDRNIPGVEGARELVKWAFKAEKNEISPVFEFGGKYIIAKLNSVKDKGVLPLDAVRTEVEAEAKKEKKAEILIKKLNDAKGAGSLDAIASKLNGRVEPIQNVTFSAGFVPGLGREAEISAQAFILPKGKLSEPIKGESGVYIMQVDEVKTAPATTDYKNQINTLAQQFKSRAEYEVFEALKEKSDIKDNRIKFY
jgi:peptidyl-prolyl cis-trans isomerase D